MMNIGEISKIAEAQKLEPLTTAQKSNIAVFFGLFKKFFPSNYDIQIPNPETLSFLFNKFSREIGAFTLEQIERGFDRASEYKQAGNPRFDFVDIHLLLGVINGKYQDGTQKPPAGAFSYADAKPAITRDRSALTISAHSEAMSELGDFLDD